MARSREVFLAHAAAAGLPTPPLRGKIGGYATGVLAQIPALRVVSDGDSDRRHHLQAMENGARDLLARVEASAAQRQRPPRRAKVTPTPRPPTASEVIEIRAAYHRAAYRRAAAGIRLPRVDLPHAFGH